MPLLEVNQVSKSYHAEGAPVVALKNVSFTANEGEWIALVGRSGCGKSTLLNLCGAMDFPTEGKVAIDGTHTSQLSDQELTRLRREKVGFIFQSFQLLHTLTVQENVELPLLLAGRASERDAVRERLAWVELEGFAQRFPHQLSGGQQQRVAIARALVQNPRILLADEPTGNLDTTTGELVLHLLRRAAADLKVTILMATHSQESISLTDRVIRMRDGQIEADTAVQ